MNDEYAAGNPGAVQRVRPVAQSKAASEALVVGRGIVDPSGDDVTLSAAAAPPAGAIKVCFETGVKGLSLFAHAEYVRPDDPRIGAAGAVWLGAYPRPLDPSGPRAVEFALRP